MYRIGIIAIIAYWFLFDELHGRYVFIATGYPRRYGHGKSYNRAKKHYKNNWSFLERLIWVPIFKEWYEYRYKIFPFLSYIHSGLTVFTAAWFLISVDCFPDSKSWIYVFAVYNIFSLLRWIYHNGVGRAK